MDTKNTSGSVNTKTVIKVEVEIPSLQKKEYVFDSSFTIGRSDECQVKIEHGTVSRVHLEIFQDSRQWFVRDKQSSNGTYLNEEKITQFPLKDKIQLRIGTNGPLITLSLAEQSAGQPVTTSIKNDPSVTQYIKHYFDDKSSEAAGEHTRMMREAFKVIKKKQTSKYLKIIIAVGLAAIVLAIYLIMQSLTEKKQMKLAENVFYDMKSLELEISAFRDKLAEKNDPALNDAIKKFDARHKQLEKNYDALVGELGTYNLNEQEKLIVKTARIFGECELNMPKEFIAEVKKYISFWRSGSRLINALQRAKDNNYTPIIVNYLVRQKLPPQFFYLALQESDFKEQVVGPQTRYGYAKGMWQFIAETAKRYGLMIGPYAELNIYDTGDERFNFPKATIAASRYLKDIYNTDAQASGLLVMASYNWGEYNIIQLIRTMPENPRDRNFWNFLRNYRDRIPDETYNYVFYIFSAAVIGENPRLFGFNFDNPLKDALKAINY